ncbi:malonyl-ACP O-methyltransferase BioC [Legionella impletisoli]|uniref:Malonyl-[acyl-carrier protein] O-methyltransferase n=1 Tax=Legionella impletisoli TaxID=343510 RepID=A0A917ND34_9GAMM|nr:malonyl-ACP O-methyltransferase BioC [Legionella impletisoli]GGI86031.1 malonyl-[acyl-carrier protein] O-methyltransferase [Legionella impletisoli]
MNRKTEICNSFNKQAKQYERAAKIQIEIGNRLFERLDYLKINPRFILDLGCGTGLFTQKLKKQYPHAKLVGLDFAEAMLQEAKTKQGWRRKWSLVNGDMAKLPFATGVFDLVFANQVLHWSSPLGKALKEISRVMNVNGCLMFTTLGPDTFMELRHAWEQVDHFSHVNDFVDMHDLGDALMQQHYLDPVVDMEMLTVHFKTLEDLLYSLKSQGVRNIHSNRNKGLTGKQRLKKFKEAYCNLRTENDRYPLTYEVVYGHAWKGAIRQTNHGTETVISIEQLKRTL